MFFTFEKAARRAKKTPAEAADGRTSCLSDEAAVNDGWIWKGNSQTKKGNQQHVNEEMTIAVVLNARPSSRQKRAKSCCCIPLRRSQYLRVFNSKKEMRISNNSSNNNTIWRIDVKGFTNCRLKSNEESQKVR